MTTQTIEFNAAECIKATSDIGSTTYQNICNGTQSVVPWGGYDWLEAGAVSAMTLFFVLIVVGFGYAVIKLIRDDF